MNSTTANKTQTNMQKLEKAMLGLQTLEKFELQRNLSLGGAALNAAILVALTQVGAKDVGLKLTTIAASLSLPLWVALGLLYEVYIHLGPRSYAHYSTKFPQLMTKWLAFPSAVGLVVGIGGIVYYLLPGAVVGILLCAVAAIVVYGLFIYELADWWCSNAQDPSS